MIETLFKNTCDFREVKKNQKNKTIRRKMSISLNNYVCRGEHGICPLLDRPLEAVGLFFAGVGLRRANTLRSHQ